MRKSSRCSVVGCHWLWLLANEVYVVERHWFDYEGYVVGRHWFLAMGARGQIPLARANDRSDLASDLH
nr:hypothetical protein Iba_chr07bCG3000 [Ipomoea batatas]